MCMQLSVCVNKHNSTEKMSCAESQNMTRKKSYIRVKPKFGPQRLPAMVAENNQNLRISSKHMIRPLNHRCLGQDCTFLMVAMDVNEPFRGFTDVLL